MDEPGRQRIPGSTRVVIDAEKARDRAVEVCNKLRDECPDPINALFTLTAAFMLLRRGALKESTDYHLMSLDVTPQQTFNLMNKIKDVFGEDWWKGELEVGRYGPGTGKIQ